MVVETGKSDPTFHLELRPELRWFSEEMEAVLRKNDYKHGICTDDLFKGLVREVFELDRERHKGNTTFLECVPKHLRERVAKEAIDVANYAMMIAWDYRVEEITNE